MKPNNRNADSPLGKPVSYCFEYNPELLFPIPRSQARMEIGVRDGQLPFYGADIWNAYEISWLDPGGKPQVGVGTFHFSADTERIIESKSMKLYLNSLNQTEFDTPDAVAHILESDLARAVNGQVRASLILPDRFDKAIWGAPSGICLDDLVIETRRYTPDPDVLTTESNLTEECVYSNLLRTNCPVTGQPDWATVFIEYTGPAIRHDALLKYIISFRNHTGFHENCVERIFMDIFTRCRPEKLLIYARFTRRGGIDINPYRANYEPTIENFRLFRQ